MCYFNIYSEKHIYITRKTKITLSIICIHYSMYIIIKHLKNNILVKNIIRIYSIY